LPFIREFVTINYEKISKNIAFKDISQVLPVIY